MLSVFKVIKKVSSNFSLSFITTKFKNNSHDIFEKNKDLTLPSNLHTTGSKPSKTKSIIVFTILLTLIILSFKKDLLIYSEVSLPHKNALLNRTHLLKQIEDNFKKQEPGIQSVILVGPGGSGKTTVARLYGRSQNIPIVYEINAETKSTIITSFQNLADNLVKSETSKEKAEFNSIQQIKNEEEKEIRIVSFVKGLLKKRSNWFLVYDNTESASDLINYFPTNTETWGHGKIIITKRHDDNIDFFPIKHDHIIQIGELSENEAFSLFVKIFFENTPNKIDKKQQTIIKDFLKNIPLFPLDVSVAAYYLKTTRIPYEKYLQYLKENDQHFISTQQDILKGSGNYSKTRYGIVTLSLMQLINTHKDFKDLLVLLSLLDSQNIPIDLLYTYKDKSTVDYFVQCLKKHSLILVTDNFFDLAISSPTLSIHRNIQEITRTYLHAVLNLKKDSQSFFSAATTLGKYVDEMIYKDNGQQVLLLIKHCERFLNHHKLLTVASIGIIKGALGSAHSWAEDYGKAAPLLTESFEILNKHCPENYGNIAHVLICLGSTHAAIGDHEKPESFIEQALLIYQKHFPNNHSMIAYTLVKLGRVYKMMGCYEEAKDSLEQALFIHQKYFPENQVDIIISLYHLGDAYRQLSDYTKARSLLEQASRICRQKIPDNDSKLMSVLFGLGILYRNMGHYDKALDTLEKVLKICHKYHLESNAYGTRVVTQLGLVYREIGDYERARELLEQACLTYKNLLLENSPDNARLLGHLGRVYNKLGYYEKAKECFETALIIYQKFSRVYDVDIARLLEHLGDFYLERKDYKKAEEFLTQSLNTYQRYLPQNHVYIGSALLRLGRLFKNLKNYEKANKYSDQSLLIFEKCYGKNHVQTGKALKNLGEIALLNNQLIEAEAFFCKALEIFQKNKHPEIYLILEDCAELYLKKSEQSNNTKKSQELKKKSVSQLRQAIETLNTYFPKESKSLIRIKTKLSQISFKED
ncbi:MAG: tetratricopeptide repeat protein [Proteobacteria bacterium]|nr:tetratricopeptide repeat protein [Pseudomonadota bacterium]